MPLEISGRAGPQNLGDGQPGNMRLGEGGQQIVSDLHGKYYESARRGRMFIGSSASGGIALIVPATTGGHPTLFNPLGSGRDLSIVRLELSYVSGNNAPTALEWAVTKNAGSVFGTGSPIVTMTKVAAEPARIGSEGQSVAIWSPTTNTFVAAPVFIRAAGLSLFTGVAATAVAPFPLVRDYDGDLVIAPGTALSLCSQAATTTALFQVTVVWEEIQIASLA